MKVKVVVKYLTLSGNDPVIKKTVIETEDTIHAAIMDIEITTDIPLSARLNESYFILINGRSSNLFQKETVFLKDGDVIAILPRLGGG